jgi:hypothetical protein
MQRALLMMAIKTRVAYSSCRNEYECLIVFVLSAHITLSPFCSIPLRKNTPVLFTNPLPANFALSCKRRAKSLIARLIEN